ncbi:MAG: DNA repair protein RecO [Actinobacteria bacterium]|nr:DNA repair protein RecO [Actinomycetota bacterium]
MQPRPDSQSSPRGSGRGGPVFSDLGIVLRSYKLGESDKILRILTREHGKRSAVAKGLRKTTSRFGARLEPFTCAGLLMHKGRSMDIIKQAEIKTSFQEVRGDLDLFMRASAMAELVDTITEEHEPSPELFDLLLKGLELLKEFPVGAAFTLAFFEFRVLAVAGFELRVTACTSCGRSIGPGEVSFSLKQGGFVCDACRGDARGDAGKVIRICEQTARLLAWMSGHDLGEWPGDMKESPVEGEFVFLMDRVLEHWMERGSRSRRVMKVIPGGSRSNNEGGNRDG